MLVLKAVFQISNTSTSWGEEFLPDMNQIHYTMCDPHRE